MEAIKVISMLIALGAVGWMGMAILIGDNPSGAIEYDYDTRGALTKAGVVFLVAVTINNGAGHLDRIRK